MDKVDEFLAIREDILDKLAAITGHLEDHCGLLPETVSAGHVETLAHIDKALADIARACGITLC